MVRTESMRRTLTDKLAAHFKAHPSAWIDGRELAQVAWYAAYRTRISDCRKLGMTIDNKLERVPTGDGYIRQSWYRYVPAEEQVA